MEAQPPNIRASDVLRNISNAPRGPAGGLGLLDGTTRTELVAEAARAVKSISGSGSSGYCDLYDLLAGTRREETFQPYFPGWPSLLRPMSPTLYDLPAMVQEKYRTCQTMCFCGVFPQIGRAWASVDNSLFLWRYDSGDVPVEYCGEEQAICAVGLVKPKPGVFLEAIQHVIVLCTTTEIVLLGVCAARRTAGAKGSSGAVQASAGTPAEIALQPLPLYTVASDNVIMTCIATSSNGRIFMGGADGHLYELQYAASDSWGRKRCQKVRITGRLQQLLPSFIPSMLGLGHTSAVDKVVVDDERHILYCLNQPSTIQVFDLGAKGTDPASKVAEINDFYQAAANANGGRDTFRNAAAEKKSAAIKYITPISSAESSKLHLLVITADGRRVYFTTQHLRSSYYNSYSYSNSSGSSATQEDPSKARPMTLTAVFARQSLPLGRTAVDLARPAALEVVAAHYSGGTLLLSEAAGSDGRTTKLLLATRNYTLPLAASTTSAPFGNQGLGGLRELLTELDNFVPGETCAIEAVPVPSSLGSEVSQRAGASGGGAVPSDELTAQLFNPPPRYVLISTAGCVELEKRRPLDLLAQVLEERVPTRLRHFFDAFGPQEAAAMTVAIASSGLGNMSAAAVREAISVLDNPAFVGEPRMPEDIPSPSGTEAQGTTGQASGGIYMGQAVNPNPEPDWSAAHRGLCLHVSRLLAPVWDMRLVAPAKSGDSMLQCRLSSTTITGMVERLHCLDAFLVDFLNRRQQRGTSSRYSPVRTGLQGIGGGYNPTASGLGGGLFGTIHAQEDPAGAAMATAAQHAAKRQRLSHAAQLEDERTARVRGLVARTSEALVLLQILSSNNLARLSLRLDEHSRRALATMTLRDLVCDAAAEKVATRLISCLVTQQLDSASPAGGSAAASVGGAVAGVEELSGALQRGCPSYFRADDRAFYSASAKLKAAEGAQSPSDRSGLVREALNILGRVPLCANLEFLSSQLAYLKAWDGIVEIPLAAAAAADSEGSALRPELGPECEAAQERRGAAYGHVFGVLRALSSGSGNPGAQAAIAAGVKESDAQKPLPAAERAQAKSAMLRAALSSSDPFFHSCLYDALIDMGEVSTLLSSGAPHLEAYLVANSGCGGALQAAAAAGMLHGSEGALLAMPPVGPLTAQQLNLANLLAKLYIGQQRFREAAILYTALGMRASGAGERAVTLGQRVKSLQLAVLQAKSAGDAGLAEKLEADARLMGYQADVASRLSSAAAAAAQGSAEASQLSRMASDLASGLRDVSEMYNDYTQPQRMWDICLQLVDFAGGVVDSTLVRNLWDHTLLAAWEGTLQGSQPGSGRPASGVPQSLAQLSEVLPVVERLGSQFYPSESSFPVAHVVFRLCQLAAGAWPAPAAGSSAGAPADSAAAGDAIAQAIVSACRGSLPAAQRVLELLLTRRAPGVPEASLATLAMRTVVLRALGWVVRQMQGELVSALVAPGLAGSDFGASGYGTPSASPFGGSSLAEASGMQTGLGSLPLAAAQRDCGALAEACDRYAMEARRAGGAAAALADTFDAVKKGLMERLSK